MSTPKVSVILTSRNHEKFLDEAIQSVLAQTYRNFELIIWDDASTDGSWEIIQQYNDIRINAFRNDVQRYGVYGVNKAISEIAQGEYIAIHHSDDVWELEKLEKQVSFLDQHPETGAVFSWINIIDDDGNINNDVYLHEIFKQDNKTRHEWLRLFFLEGNNLCHPTVLIRKQCYTDCGLYSLALWQLPDFDMWIRLCFRHEIHVLPEYLVKFRWRPDGTNTSAVNRQTLNRTGFEYYMVLNNYCRITDIREFLKIFPFSEKYCIQPDSDLEFALAMTAIEANSISKYRLFGLQLLYKLITSPERARKIHAIHHFSYMDFMNISKQMQIFAPQDSSPSFQALESPFPLTRGIQAFNSEDNETAIECLSAAMTQEPDNPLPPAYLAFICARQGLLQEAFDFIVQSTKIAPNRADLVAALGETFLKNNRPFEAVKYLREAVHAQPDLFAAYPALAQSLHLTGQSEEAVSLLQTVATLPSSAQTNIQNTLLQILAECGDLSEFTKFTLRFSTGVPDDLLAARCLARFDENGETFLETLSRIQGQLGNVTHFRRNKGNAIQNGSGLTKIAFMVGDFTSRHQLEQLYALFLHLPTERFFTLFISCHTHPDADDMVQMCVLLADTFLSIRQEKDNSAIEVICAHAPDILINMQAYAPSERLAVFLAAPVPHKFLWGEAPMPPITPDVQTLAGAFLSVENTLPTVKLPEMGELFNLPELPFTDDTARKTGGAVVLGCLVPAQGIARNGWQLFAETLRQYPEATLVINLEELGQAAQTFISGQFSNAGVDSARLVFISVRTAEEFCLAWQSIDLGLLPPANPGGLALSTCLWMGKPCLAPASVLPWSQRPAALLKALGREKWIAADAPDYVDIARQLAGQRVIADPTLRDRLKALGLTDAKGFARGFADAMTGLHTDLLYSTMKDGLLRIRITNRCNAKCRFCGIKSWPDDVQKMRMKNEILYEYCKPLYEQIKILLLTGGDPLISAESFSYCRFISENYPHLTLFLETNGISFTEKWQKLAIKHLMKVHISVNASNEDVYSKGCWEGKPGKTAYRKFTKNIKDYMALLKEEGLEIFAPDISMVINKDTAHDVRSFVKYALTEKLYGVTFYFDYTENNMGGEYFGLPSTSRMALFELMKLERVLAGKFFIYFRLWIPLKEAEMMQPTVEAIPIEELREEYSDILELAKDRSMKKEYESRQKIRKSKEKKEFNFDEDWTPTIRQITVESKDICFAPFHSMDIYPDQKFECCGWINPRFSVNAAVENDSIDWEKQYNRLEMKKIRQDMLMGRYTLCQKCCPLNPTYNRVCSSHQYGYDRIDQNS